MIIHFIVFISPTYCMCFYSFRENLCTFFDCRITMYRKKKTSIIPSTTTNDIDDDKFLNDLNPEQKRAVTCSTNQSTLVLSGAGLVFFFKFFKLFSFDS
jgi:hypothetical protein